VKPVTSSPERRRRRKESRHDDGEAIERFAASRLDAEHGKPVITALNPAFRSGCSRRCGAERAITRLGRDGGRHLVPEVPAGLECGVQTAFFSDVRWAKTTTFAE
jgi:hypothetical protein